MNTLMKKLKLSSSILLTTTFLAVSSGVQEVKAQSTGENAWGKGIDLAWYCDQVYPDQTNSETTAVLISNDITGWKCRVTLYGYYSTDHGIDIGDACLRIYGTYTHGYGNFWDPYSWFCGNPKRDDYQYIRWG